MRITPVVHLNRNLINRTNGTNTGFESKSARAKVQNASARKYTGVASADLAYASLFDSEIARDLKLMGLI